MDPDLTRKLNRFCRQKRAYYSLWVIGICFLVSLFAEWLCNNTPFVMRLNGKLYFPMFKFYQASEFGDMVHIAPDYKWLVAGEPFKESGNWALFPPIPFAPNETVSQLPTTPPSPPTLRNWLGTDDRGRDLLTRLVYGFRNSMLFALASWFFICIVAYAFGATQAFIGARVDFLMQRFTEVWHALPVLYVIIFLLSVFTPNLLLLTLIWVAFSWIPLATYVRAEVLRIRKTDFIAAAKALGASTPRILFLHVLPSAIAPLLTFSPFIISASIGSLAALDYLGLGLAPPTASWGELLRQGKENLSSWWLALYPFFALFATLTLLNFIGEGVRSAFNVKEAL